MCLFVTIFEDTKKSRLDLPNCKTLSIIDSDIDSVYAPNFSVLHLKNTNLSLKSIDCPNVKKIYAGNNNITGGEINLINYKNLSELDIRTNDFPSMLNKNDATTSASVIRLK